MTKIQMPEPVGYARKDQLNKVQRGWSHMCQIQPEPQQDTVPIYTEPQPAQQMTDDTLWCLHILGPDDLHAAPSKAVAEIAADLHNATFDKESKRTGVMCKAVVAPWPFDAKSHARDVGELVGNWLAPQVIIQSSRLQKGDQRIIDGKVWVCTDPDIDRWVCSDSTQCGELGKSAERTQYSHAVFQAGFDYGKAYGEMPTTPAQEPDDDAVDRFAAAMKAKLAEKRTEGRGGWQDMSAADLSALLHEHVTKGDPLDVANIAMMLHQNAQSIVAAAAQEPVGQQESKS